MDLFGNIILKNPLENNIIKSKKSIVGLVDLDITSGA